ncbi:hypothetical protein [Magnetospira sp. QH-2]|uniref:hypothetical protein n=1 Tax=Magnetospira sp. (strain QH-2) TaxID=1288970 RepID=UPI0003E81701|nr:hypothetical protein [Magnetospira sp. QH-2]CCQ73732.1 Membrane protein of unknown function [Magnetospira sp. QH-2]
MIRAFRRRPLHWTLAIAFLLAYGSAEGPLIVHLSFGYLVAAATVPAMIKWLRKPRRAKRTSWGLVGSALVLGLTVAVLSGLGADTWGGLFEDLHEMLVQIPLIAAGLHALLALKPVIRKRFKAMRWADRFSSAQYPRGTIPTSWTIIR